MMFGCGGCDARWQGANTSHCANTGCHQTFSTVGNFDRHRRGGECREPSTVGLIRNGRSYPCWGLPGQQPEEAA